MGGSTIHRDGGDIGEGMDTRGRAMGSHVDACAACQDHLEGLLRRGADATISAAVRIPCREHLPEVPGFAIEREVGRGGMGVVYLARQASTGRPVALKFLPSGPFTSPRDRDRWLGEAKAFAAVPHPHIVTIHDVGEAEGWLYLVLEYVRGSSLKERLAGPLSPRLAARLLIPVAEAVEALHRANLLHLDLKPANLLVDAPPEAPLDGARLRVTDFGIARALDGPDPTGTSRGAARGTPAYMAPEQVEGAPSGLGRASDIHALGAVLYELLTGRPPFLAASDAETMHQVRHQDPVSPSRLNPKVPRDLETIILKCLRKEPPGRYASARELADDLQRWIDGRPIRARPASMCGRAWRWCRRRPAVAALASALAITLVASILGLFALWRRAEAERAVAVAARRAAEAHQRVAEEQQRVAEAHQKTAMQMLIGVKETTEILAGSVAFGKEAAASSNWNANLSRSAAILREQVAILKPPPPHHGDLLALAGRIERGLATQHIQEGRKAEGRRRMEEVAAHLRRGLRDGLRSELLLSELFDCLFFSAIHAEGDIIENRGRFVLDRFREAASVVRLMKDADARISRVVALSGHFCSDAIDLYHGGGNLDAAALYLRADLELLDSLSGEDVNCAPIEICRSACKTLLEQLGDFGRGTGTIPGARTGEKSLRSARVTAYAGVIASTVLAAARAKAHAVRRSAGAATVGGLPPWASLLRDRNNSLRADRRSMIGIANATYAHLLPAMTHLREAGALDEARDVAEQNLALADEIVRLFPDDPEAHVLLGEAYQQITRNAMLGSRDGDHGADRRRVTQLADSSHDHLYMGMVRLREAGSIDEAHRIAEKNLAFAEDVAGAFPDDPEAQVLLSEAYYQFAKNAMRREDRGVIALWIRKAMIPASRAVELAPSHADAHRLMERYRDRLAEVEGGPNTPSP